MAYSFENILDLFLERKKGSQPINASLGSIDIFKNTQTIDPARETLGWLQDLI